MALAVVDACVLINLLATSLEVELTQVLGLSWLMTDLARAETLFLDSPPDAEGIRQRTVADVSRLESIGCLKVRTLDAEWMPAFVRCAAYLPDPDASSVALAGALGLPLVTDDPKERRVAAELFPGIELRSTLGILLDSVTALGFDDARLRRLAYDLRWRGNFLPPRRDPNREWFQRLLDP